MKDLIRDVKFRILLVESQIEELETALSKGLVPAMQTVCEAQLIDCNNSLSLLRRVLEKMPTEEAVH